MTLNEFMEAKTKWNDEWHDGWHFTEPLNTPTVVCDDGFWFKCSVGEQRGSLPSENNEFPYSHFGIFSTEAIPTLRAWFAGQAVANKQLMFSYAFVPEIEVEELIAMHGGLVEDA